MIRVLHMQMTKSIGGIAAVQRELLNGMDRGRFQMDFVTTYPDAALIPYAEAMGAKVFRLPREKTVLSYCRELYRLLKQERYDIVHIHKNACADPLACIVSRLAGVGKVLVHSHNTGSINGKWGNVLHYLFRPIVCKLAHGKIACGREAGRWMFGKKKPFRVVYNGIDLSKYAFREPVRRQVRKQLGVQDQLVVGHVGNFIPQKNHRFIIDIMAELIKICPDAVLLIVGRGETMETIKDYAQSKGIKEYVRFLGARADVAELYQGMDVFLFPSLHEGFPVVGIEAQTAGLPCVFSDAVTEEVVLTKRAVRLPLRLPASQWARKITELAGTVKRTEAADKMLKSSFSTENMARNMEKIYEDLLKRS